MKKKRIISMIIIAAIAVAVLIFSALSPAKAGALAEDSYKKLQVRGEGTVSISPDMAILHLGVQKKNQNASDAQKEVTEVLESLIQMLLSESVQEADIQTTYYSIYPDYRYKEDESILTGYNVSSSLSVKVRDVDKAGSLLEKAVSAGANTGSGISYEISESSQAYRNALLLALEDARAKAGTIAEALGISDYSVIEIEEEEHGYSYNRRGIVAYDSMKASGGIMSGKIEVTAAVEVTYSF